MQVQQVVLNLVLTGLDAQQESAFGGRALVLWTAREGADAVQVAAGDFGVGIDEADLDRIFQVFDTTQSAGLGMRLAIARSIVEAHGGPMDVEGAR